ncbi:MAG TPA: NrfD/PsrC family molybdoenzyme membrane anchor subunit [Anaeromyxobacteraceae bacterium]|nr:NrfD/PsrC family molybdoenzyme membrane anchor subunit [Anaeromyxobacteraceae bacterium]
MDPLNQAEARHDGRNIDPDIGLLAAEGSTQKARDATVHPARATYEEIAAAAREEEGTSYYGLPVLCEPVWNWMIPAYFFTGGLAGACAVLGGAVQAMGGRGTDLVRRCRLVAAGGSIVSAGLLIADLGRPSRFVNMLRVFRPSSPMNMGTWVLSGFGACSAASILPEVLAVRRGGRAGRLLATRRRSPRWIALAADRAGYGAAAFGLPLVGYTGVLLANTAVPVWQQTRHTLPVLFAFSGAVSAGALFDVWPPRRGSGIAHRFGLLARGAEVAASAALDREASTVPRVARPLRHGVSGAMLNTARAMLVGSLLSEILPLPRRAKRIASGTLALVGTALLRFGIVQAGRASARDPHATFEMQRAGRGAGEVVRRGDEPGAGMPALHGVGATGEESVQHGATP